MNSLTQSAAFTRYEPLGWRGHLTTLAACVVLTIVIFFRDIADMANMWWNVSTYGHCIFILPIIGWMISQRRDELIPFAPQGWWPGLIFVFAASMVWMLGEAAGVGLFRHAGVILLVQAVTLTILGPAIVRAVLFPVFYLVFLIPAGEELVPLLQTVTANLTIALLGVSNVPHQVNGVFITIPGGYFEIAEECSGVKFLIAMTAYGALVANVCFRSWRRRAAFMAVSVIMPILANGVRAFGTVYAAWMIDRDFAKGFDHVVYGWFFFAIVLALVMAIGWRFFDRKVSDPWLDGLSPSTASASVNPLLFGGAAMIALIVPLAWQSAIASTGRVDVPNQISLPTVLGWERAQAAHRFPWAPHFLGADHLVQGNYRTEGGDQVDFAIAVYGWQAEGRELVGYGQGAIDPASSWAWASEAAKPRFGKAERIAAPGPISREVLSVYWVDGRVTGSASDVKFATLKTRLIGGEQAGVALLISAEDRPGKPARPSIDRFMTALGPPERIAEAVVAIARGR
jgi:exosortase A